MHKGSLAAEFGIDLAVVRSKTIEYPEDYELFLGEAISNANDALIKRQYFTGQDFDLISESEFGISVTVDYSNHSITISDNGIGMTEDEVKKYLIVPERSGTADFLNQYPEANTYAEKVGGVGLWGRCGLGFYFLLLVSDRVEMNTLSYQPGAAAIQLNCNKNLECEIKSSDKKQIGTEITLLLDEESRRFVEPSEIKILVEECRSRVQFPFFFEGEIINSITVNAIRHRARLLKSF